MKLDSYLIPFIKMDYNAGLGLGLEVLEENIGEKAPWHGSWQ